MNKTHACYSTEQLFRQAPIWQLWVVNDCRLKTLGPSALLSSLKANVCITVKANVWKIIM